MDWFKKIFGQPKEEKVVKEEAPKILEVKEETSKILEVKEETPKILEVKKETLPGFNFLDIDFSPHSYLSIDKNSIKEILDKSGYAYSESTSRIDVESTFWVKDIHTVFAFAKPKKAGEVPILFEICVSGETSTRFLNINTGNPEVLLKISGFTKKARGSVNSSFWRKDDFYVMISKFDNGKLCEVYYGREEYRYGTPELPGGMTSI